jgi:hypothetical protein
MSNERKGAKIDGKVLQINASHQGIGLRAEFAGGAETRRSLTRLDHVALGIRDRFRPPSPSPYSSPLTLHRSPLTLHVLRPLGLAPAAVIVRCFYSRHLFS